MKILLEKIKSHSYIKLFLRFITVLVIPMAVISIIFSSVYMRLVNKNANELYEHNFSSLNTAIDTSVNRLNGNLMLYGNNEFIRQYLKAYNSGISVNDAELRAEMDMIGRSRDFGYPTVISEVAVYSNSGEILGGDYIPSHFCKDEIKSYISNHIHSRYRRTATSYWFSEKDISSDDDAAGVFAVSKILDGNESLGAVVCRVDESVLFRIYYASLLPSQNVYVFSDHMSLISSYEDFQLPEGFFDKHNAELSKMETRFNVNSTVGNSVVFGKANDTTGWHIVSAYDLSSYMQNYDRTLAVYFAATIALIGASLILAYLFSKRFTEPIVELQKTILKVGKGSLDERVKTTGTDEIGQLGMELNKTLDKLNDLMNQLVIEQEKKRKSEIKALQAQINPHFMSNILTQVRYLIASGDIEKSDKIIANLNKIVSYALRGSDQFVSINYEMEQLVNYIHILELSFDDSFFYTIEVEEDIGDYRMMKLLLQPIVENAFLHGLKPLKGEKRLTIRAGQSGSVIVFEVEDNGVGFQKDKEKPRDDDVVSHGMGIDNVDQRIKLFFGDAYGVSLVSTSPKGTKVCITIPIIRWEDEK